MDFANALEIVTKLARASFVGGQATVDEEEAIRMVEDFATNECGDE